MRNRILVTLVAVCLFLGGPVVLPESFVVRANSCSCVASLDGYDASNEYLGTLTNQAYGPEGTSEFGCILACDEWVRAWITEACSVHTNVARFDSHWHYVWPPDTYQSPTYNGQSQCG